VYDRSRHLREGETEPPPDKTEQRLGRYVDDSLAGKDDEPIRAVATKVIVVCSPRAFDERGRLKVAEWTDRADVVSAVPDRAMLQ
jgi:hypothetical protein